MADLALSSSLIDEYIKYKFNEAFDTNKMRKLLKYIQPFAIRRTHSDFFSDPSTAGQFADPLVEMIDECSDEEMVRASTLKLMLVDKAINPKFTTVNISGTLPEKLQPKYGATYPSASKRDNAKKHIKALLSDAKWVKITDGYIANNQWATNKSLIEELVPHLGIDLTIVGADIQRNQTSLNTIQKNELKTIHSGWRVQAQSIQNNIHDRYIETNKIKILLSSGLYHLSSTNKDFTYIVEIK